MILKGRYWDSHELTACMWGGGQLVGAARVEHTCDPEGVHSTQHNTHTCGSSTLPVSDTMSPGEVDRCCGSGRLMSEAAARQGCGASLAAGRHPRSCCCRTLLLLQVLLAVTRLLGVAHSLWLRPLAENGMCCRCCRSIVDRDPMNSSETKFI